jgi:hypothetical protein
MPTTKYRLSIPLDDESRAVYERMAEVLGKSLASTISEWLYETREGALVATQAMARAKTAPAAAMRELQALAEATQESMQLASAELQRMRKVGPVGPSRAQRTADAQRPAAGGKRRRSA